MNHHELPLDQFVKVRAALPLEDFTELYSSVSYEPLLNDEWVRMAACRC